MQHSTEADNPVNFLEYLRECHRHYRTIEPQTALSIAERRRYAVIYRDMRGLTPSKSRNHYMEVIR